MKDESAFPVEWRQVPEWPQYEVSNDGQVRSLVGSGFAKLKRKYPKYRATYTGKDGYPRVTLFENSHSTNRRTETWTLHRMVAMAFIPTDDLKLHVAHLDGNKQNNHVSNLKWCTRKENESHKVAHGTRASGVKNGHAVLCDKSIKAIRILAKDEKWSRKKISNLFQISQGHVSAIVLRKIWHHL